MITTKPLGALLAGLLLLAGCSDDGGDNGSDATEATATPWEPTPGLCELITPDERAALLALDDPRQLNAPQLMGGQGCAWVHRKRPEIQLILISMSTQDWIRDLPAALDAQLGIDDLTADDRAGLQAIKAEIEALDSEDSDDLCGFFSRIAAIQGYPEGSTTTVYATRGTAGLSAQNCEGDTFTSLVGRSKDIGQSEAKLDAYQAAVEEVADAR